MMKKLCFILLFIPAQFLFSQVSKEKLQLRLDSLLKEGNFPGLSIAIANENGEIIALTSGYNDKEKMIRLKTDDMLMQGSVGKTYVSAIALILVKYGVLSLDQKVSTYLGSYEWYKRVPNAATITVRQIMNHTSGVMRYEFKRSFLDDLNASPEKTWKPEELLAYVLDEKAAFVPGEDWEYSDTNYILLGMIIEKLTKKKYYDLLNEFILKPYQLNDTRPTDKILLPRLSQGYAGEGNDFLKKDKVIDDNGKFVINPQFEWTGGGIYSTTSDLAKWGKLLYEGKIIDTSLLIHNAANAKLGKGSMYGLGVIIRQTPFGTSYGHSGFFPGYLTEMAYFPSKKICIAVQANSSDFKKIKIGLSRVLVELMKDLD